MGQRNLALGLISSTEVPQQITAALANVHMPHCLTHRFHRGIKEEATVGVIDQKAVVEEEPSG